MTNKDHTSSHKLSIYNALNANITNNSASVYSYQADPSNGAQADPLNGAKLTP